MGADRGQVPQGPQFSSGNGDTSGTIIDVRTDDHDRPDSAKRLARAGQIDELRRRADVGDAHAARHLAVWLARAGHLDELRERMAAGDRSARWAYSDFLVRRRRIPEAVDVLRPLAELGIPGAQRRLARLLAGLGHCAQAMAVLAQAPPHWADRRRVEGWLNSRDLLDLSVGPVSLRRDYLDALRRGVAAGDPDARQQLSWIVLLRWRSRRLRIDDTVALLDDIGPSDWLHERLVCESQGWWLSGFRAAAADALATADTKAYHRTRAALLMLQGQHNDAVAQLRSLAADGDRHAQRDLAVIFDAEPPQREIRIADHPNPISLNGIVFGPDGKTLAAWGHDVEKQALVVVWDITTGAQRYAQGVSNPWASGMVFRPDGALHELPGDPPWRHRRYCLASPDGSVQVDRTRGRVRLRRAATGELIRDIIVPGRRHGAAMAFNPDSTVLAIGAGIAGVHFYQTATGRPIRTIATPTDAVAFHPDGTMLATANSLDGTIRLWGHGQTENPEEDQGSPSPLAE
ncbi:hypothetical protein GCM10007977_109340 [Dactylosporangium sucinum]|uniref:Uncharacterized protein n=2 Tax=Dactylosporangium sucinum TaxID=1424081 RepID=A0A917UHG2_9ACTN|nr:hypothetical protein GCM10007977_109340 [Dactylosporangium sucinum]